MKILVFASCSKTKSIKLPNVPDCSQLVSKESREKFMQMIPEKRTATDLYRGALNISVTSAVRQLRHYFTVGYYIVSAGYGIVNENDIIPPYECSFSTMPKSQIIERAEQLEIPQDFKAIIEKEQPDFIYLAMGKNYMLALGEWDTQLPCKTIAFVPSTSEKVITLPADHLIVKEISSIGSLPIHGVVGYKGDLLLITTRYLKDNPHPDKALKELIDDPDGLIYTINSIRNFNL
ncbi:MAG: DUF6884 domain-containing protein [Candidatus Heimdallarchaeota archaeon]